MLHPSLAAAIAMACLATAARAQGAPCETWAILSADKASGKVLACSQLLREVPALKAAVDRLNATVASTADGQRELERLVRALGATSQQLPPKLVAQLAQTITDKLGKAGDASAALEVKSLRADLDDIKARITDARNRKEIAPQVDEALAGRAGEAVARIDVRAAEELLAKLDVGPYASNPTLLAQVRKEAEAAWQKLQAAKGPQRCAKAMPDLTALRSAAEDADRRGQPNTAGASWADLRDRLLSAVAELDQDDAMATMHKSTFQSMRGTVAFTRDLSARQVATPQQAAALQQVDALLAEADALGRAGRWAAAYNRMADAQEKMPEVNPRLPKAPMPRQQESVTWAGASCR